MPANQPLLFLFGAGDKSDQVSPAGLRTRVTGSTDLGRLLPEEVVRHRLMITPDFAEPYPDIRGYPVIANLITEPERNAALLRKLDKWLSSVPQRVINPPAAVLSSTRDQVAALLTGIDGLIVPKTVRFRASERGAAARSMAAAGAVILRRPGTHSGDIVGLFDSLERALDAVEGDGDYIATEFVDCRSPDGLYRKIRIFFIGPHRIVRHKLIDDNWSVHGAARPMFMAPRPELIAEEAAMFEDEDPFAADVSATLNTVRARMPLDFFGMDFAFAPDGQVVLFEANATMSFMPNLLAPKFPHVRRCIEPARAALMELLGVSA